MRALAVIPARLESQRLPEKVLLAESGRPLIQHVYERVRQAPGLDHVVVATDAPEVVEACRSFGAEALMTRADHVSGTDRVAEAARQLEESGRRFDVVLNVQGDEPEIAPAALEELLAVLAEHDDPMATLAEPLLEEEAALSQVVKVALGAGGRALYFSRAAIPFLRDRSRGFERYRHVGVYGFRADFLQTFPTLERCELERVEGLEQLRALYHGYALRVGLIPRGASGRGIDTREDYDAFLARVRAGEEED